MKLLGNSAFNISKDFAIVVDKNKKAGHRVDYIADAEWSFTNPTTPPLPL